MVNRTLNSSEIEHERALEAILSDPGIIGENVSRAHYILTNIKWYGDNSKKRKKYL